MLLVSRFALTTGLTVQWLRSLLQVVKVVFPVYYGSQYQCQKVPQLSFVKGIKKMNALAVRDISSKHSFKSATDGFIHVHAGPGRRDDAVTRGHKLKHRG